MDLLYEMKENSGIFFGINDYLFNIQKLDINKELEAKGDRFEVNWCEPIDVFNPNKDGTEYSNNFASKDEQEKAFISVHYKRYSLHLTNYTYSVRTHQEMIPKNFPQGWTLEGSKDGKNYVALHSTENSNELSQVNAIKTYPCFNEGSYSYFRLKMTQINTNQNWIFHVHKIEFFGTLIKECAHLTCKHSIYIARIPFLAILIY